MTHPRTRDVQRRAPYSASHQSPTFLGEKQNFCGEVVKAVTRTTSRWNRRCFPQPAPGKECHSPTRKKITVPFIALHNPVTLYKAIKQKKKLDDRPKCPTCGQPLKP